MSKVSTVYLKHARKVNKCGRTCHIYLPESMEGQEVIGLLMRDNRPENNQGLRPISQAMMNKDDEYYTLYKDIEPELSHYDLRGKVVYCPCDTDQSNFWKYLCDNYDKLGLKGLMRSSLSDYQYYNHELIEYPMNSFDSPKSYQMFKECDIVITNPPFSRFRDFYTFIKSKPFILVAPIYSLFYVASVNDFVEGKIWVGYTHFDEFDSPEGIKPLHNIVWITNYGQRPVYHYEFTKSYTPDEYPKLDNMDIINIDKSSDIPDNYYGLMAVPVSYAQKFDYEMFKVMGWATHSTNKYNYGTPYLNGKKLFKRIVIKRIK